MAYNTNITVTDSILKSLNTAGNVFVGLQWWLQIIICIFIIVIIAKILTKIYKFLWW